MIIFKYTAVTFKKLIIVSLILLCGSCALYKKRSIGKSEKAFTVYLKDSVPVSVDLLFDRTDKPYRYRAHVSAPVCEEEICYPLVIDVSWDLLGNFDGYSLPIDSPLTKFDHEVFNKDDVRKMHEILSDKSSILKFYSSQELVDSSETKVSSVIDGVTGATRQSLKNLVVSGAVHSSYVLWHIINGAAADSILQHTEAIFNDSMLVRMLESDNYHYQYYALEKIPADKVSDYVHGIIRLIGKGGEYVPYFAIEKIPDQLWLSSDVQQMILNLLSHVDFKIQNQVINRLKGKRLSEIALEKLIADLQILQPGQIISSLEIITANQDFLNYNLLLKLSTLLNNPNVEVSEKIYQMLKNKSETFPGLKKIMEKYKEEIKTKKE